MGPGIDYYFSNKLAIETDKVAGGFNDTWTYSNTIGYHVNIICEFSPSLNWSFNFGLKWYNISYSFAHGGVHSSNATNKFQAPDGSGLEFSVGLYLNF
ncbi:hypothetical protein SDC9_202795 [bioreactor metagenome]|uniref:Outer membrane protein beta-barrel domain-containing protein n=1 Tax=bioreactor metagenome TaxID=1076179 RepID=A0A645IVB4_9ZZZZ